MTLGPAKREILAPIIAEQRPRIIMDVGAYVGYSALMLGGALVDIYGRGSVEFSECKVYSFEKDPMCAAITSSFIELAGLKGVVDVVVGEAAVEMKRLKEERELVKVDLLLLDHWEKLYVEDLKVVEELQLLNDGNVIVADNIICPGAPDYLKYVRGGNGAKSKLGYSSRGIESHMPNGWKVSQFVRNLDDWN